LASSLVGGWSTSEAAKRSSERFVAKKIVVVPLFENPETVDYRRSSTINSTFQIILV